MATLEKSQLFALAQQLKRARRLFFITGAGLSQASGLPTYRGEGGLYTNLTPEEGYPIEELLSGPQFKKNPALTWKYLYQLEKVRRDKKPNQAHRIIAAWEHNRSVTVLTQNIDGFHEMAGSNEVIDIHGNLYKISCTGCGYRRTVSDYRHWQAAFEKAPASFYPTCPHCQALLRPQVVLFSEALSAAHLLRIRAVMAEKPELIFSIGTSNRFPYITAPLLQARRQSSTSRAITVEINPEETALSASCDYSFRAGALETLIQLDRLCRA